MKLNIDNIIIDKNQVLKFLFHANKPQPPIILKKIDEEIERSNKLFEPLAFLKHFRIDEIKNEEISFGDIYRIKSVHAADKLKDSSSLYLALYTLGAKIENKISQHSKSNEMIRAMILDKIGVVALDNIKQQIKETIINEIAHLKISASLYPSQKDFDISNQRLIFNVFQEENDTITISRNYQLQPIKTVVVLFGIGESI